MSDLIKQTMAPGEVISWRRAAGLLLVNEASAPINIKLLTKGSAIFTADAVGRGVKVRPAEGFDETILHNAGASAVDIEVFITGAEVDVQIATGLNVTVDNSVGNPVPVVHTGTVELTADNVGVLSPSALLPLADVAIAAGAQGLVVAAAAVGVKQREVIIKNLLGNTDMLRIGDASCAAGLGHELAPGDSLKLETLAAVYAWNTGAASQSVSVLLNSRV